MPGPCERNGHGMRVPPSPTGKKGDIMKVFYVFIFIGILGLVACNDKAKAKEPEAAAPQAKQIEAKSEDHGSAWITDFEQAKKLAKEKNIPILADFSGSDWCGWCIKLDKEVFSKQKFKDYAKDNYVLLMLDFPKRTKLDPKLAAQNQKLLKKYGVRGFPTILILDADGKVIKQTSYKPGGAENYVKHLKEIKAGIKK